MNLLVTGGSGFIGSNFIKLALKKKRVNKLVNLDALTYAADQSNLSDVERDPRYTFKLGDICSYSTVYDALYSHDITHIAHFAAESHVDNSIEGPRVFVDTNIIGTFNLL